MLFRKVCIQTLTPTIKTLLPEGFWPLWNSSHTRRLGPGGAPISLGYHCLPQISTLAQIIDLPNRLRIDLIIFPFYSYQVLVFRKPLWQLGNRRVGGSYVSQEIGVGNCERGALPRALKMMNSWKKAECGVCVCVWGNGCEWQRWWSRSSAPFPQPLAFLSFNQRPLHTDSPPPYLTKFAWSKALVLTIVRRTSFTALTRN